LGASGIHADAVASCGGASASCAGAAEDCLDGGAVALYDDTGSCTMTSDGGEYVECFALAAPADASSCTASVAYDACVFECLDDGAWSASAATTSTEGGWPRVLSVCGDASASCQDYEQCRATAATTTGGLGICLSRTVDTVIECVASGAPEDAAPRCRSTTWCYVSCHEGDVVAASGISGGASVSCGGASASCEAGLDCLSEASIAQHDGTGICALTSGYGEYADCFALAPSASRTCGSRIAYDACVFSCRAGDALHAAALSTRHRALDPVGYPRVLSTCGGGAADCQDVGACYGAGAAESEGTGICLSRTVDTVIRCAATRGA
jgi:hypothetical protein